MNGEKSQDVVLTDTEKRQKLEEEAKKLEDEREVKKDKRKKSILREVIRFVIIGVLCTLVDFGVQYLMMWVFNYVGLTNYAEGYISLALAYTIAFLIANAVNFLFSGTFVFKNVDKKVNKMGGKTFLVYLLLGALGWLLGLGVQASGIAVAQFGFGYTEISKNFVEVNISELWNEGGITFWIFVIVFCIKTAVTMVYNYLTRKFIIYKAPKKEEVKPVVEQPKEEPEPVVEEELKEGPIAVPLVTASRFKKIFQEEVDNTFGVGQKKCTKGKAWKMMYEELEEFDKTHKKKTKEPLVREETEEKK